MHVRVPLRPTGGLLVVVLLVGSVLVREGRAQPGGADSLSLAERYRRARVQMLVQDYLSGRGAVPGRPPRALPVRPDSVFGVFGPPDTTAAPRRPAFPIAEVRPVRHLERGWFRERYRAVDWSFLGAGTRLTVFDTTRTWDLRARLQAQFGDPTRTMAELYSEEWRRTPDSTREDPIQFEYWFVVNDSIPVRVTDVNGPTERGVIVSTDRRYRDRLVALRAALLRPLRDGPRAPYVDYYFERASRRWFRVGFDGTAFFRERVSRFDIVPGRRPYLESPEAAPDSASTSS
jgi:hypothetical protein